VKSVAANAKTNNACFDNPFQVVFFNCCKIELKINAN